MTETLNLADGERILVSETLLGKKIEEATESEINAEKKNLWLHAMFKELCESL